MARTAKGPKWVSSEIDYFSYPEVRNLPETPSARALLDKLKLGIGRESSPIPGVCFEWTGKLKDLLRPWWTEEDIERCLTELEELGLIYVDSAVPAIVVPLALFEDASRCGSYGTAAVWGTAIYAKLKVHPRSELLEQLDRELIRQLEGTPSFLASYLFRTAYRASYRKADTPPEVETGYEALERLRAMGQPAVPTAEWRLRERLDAALSDTSRPLELRRTEQAPQPGTLQAGAADAGAELARSQAAAASAAPGGATAPHGEPAAAADQVQRQLLRRCWSQFVGDREVHEYLQLTLQHPTWSGLPLNSQTELERGWAEAVKQGASEQSWECLREWFRTCRDREGRRPLYWLKHKARWMQFCVAVPHCIRDATNYVKHREEIRTVVSRAVSKSNETINIEEAIQNARRMFVMRNLEVPQEMPPWLMDEVRSAGFDERKARELWLPDVSAHAQLAPPEAPREQA